MQSITISTINHEWWQDDIILEIHKTSTIRQIYEAYSQDVDGCPDFQQIAVCDRKHPHNRLAAHLRYDQLSNGHAQLIVIHPKRNSPIVECKIGNEHYLIYDYNKNDKLDLVLESIEEIKTIIKNEKNIKKVSINGVEIDFLKVKSTTPFAKYISGHVNTIINIIIELNHPSNPQPKNKIEIKKQESKRQDKPVFQQKLPILKELKEEKEQEQPKRVIQKQVPQLKQLKNQKQIPKVDKLINGKKEAEMRQQKPKKLLQLVIKYSVLTGNGGVSQLTKDVQRTKSLKDLLPQLVMLLKKANFDWDFTEYQHNRDISLLNITKEGQQFKEFEKALREIVSVDQASLTLTVERKYEGG